MTARTMHWSDLDAELQPVYKKLPDLTFSKWSHRAFAKLLTPFFFGAKKDEAVEITQIQLGHNHVRLYRPKDGGTDASVFWIHGGGMIMGSPTQNDRDCIDLCKSLKITVISTSYRLAPKHPFPAALDDCFDAWAWFLDEASELGLDPQRSIIIGMSAGGGLAASLCQQIRDTETAAPKAQCLIYPMLDDRTASNSALDDVHHIGWNNMSNRYGWAAYLAKNSHQDKTNALWAVPARTQDLSKLPPCWIGVGDKDLFLAEDQDYAERLIATNVPCDIHIAPGAPHGFDNVAPEAEITARFRASMTAFLKHHLSL